MIFLPFPDNNMLKNEMVINVGETKKFIYGIEPNNINIYNVKWDSSDNKVVSINDGEIKGLSAGSAVISVMVNNRKEETIVVNVKEISEESDLTSKFRFLQKILDFKSTKGYNQNVIKNQYSDGARCQKCQ